MFAKRCIALVALVLAMVYVPGASAIAPTNDDFDSATVIGSLPFTDSIDTTEATVAPDDPYCPGPTNLATVWYALTAPSDTTILVDTSGSDYAPATAVWTGTRGALTLVTCNGNADTAFATEAGTTYYIEALTGSSSQGGNLMISVRDLDAHDDFDGATVIPGVVFNDFNIDTTEAEPAADDPNCFGQGATIWYAFTPPENMRLQALAYPGSPGYDLTLSVYSGSRGSLTQLACDDSSYDPLPSAPFVDFNATGGITYYFMVGSIGPGGIISQFQVQRPLESQGTIAASGTVTQQGVATVNGTLSFSRPPEFGGMTVGLRQVFAKRLVADGATGCDTTSCSPSLGNWRLTIVTNTSILFGPGTAAAQLSGDFCDSQGCGPYGQPLAVSQTVHLKRSR